MVALPNLTAKGEPSGEDCKQSLSIFSSTFCHHFDQSHPKWAAEYCRWFEIEEFVEKLQGVVK